MPADFFLTNFVLFAVVTAACTFGQSYLKRSGNSASKDALSSNASGGSTPGSAVSQPLAQSGSARSLWRAYILVYALVMGELALTRLDAVLKTPHTDRRPHLLVQKAPTGCKVRPRCSHLLRAVRGCARRDAK